MHRDVLISGSTVYHGSRPAERLGDARRVAGAVDKLRTLRGPSRLRG